MSPEQARAEHIDHRTDIYSLGVMMYRAFTGKLPFMADSTMGVLTRHITEMPEPPSKLAPMDQATERLILRCLAKKREERFQSMREVVEALRLVGASGAAAPEHTALYQGPTAAPSASYAAATGAQLSGPQGTSGAYAQASGAYAQAQSGAYAQASGAYAQASGAHPAAYTGPSGAYGMAAPQQPPTGSYVSTPAVAPQATGIPNASLPSIQPGTSGAFAAPSGAFPPAAPQGSGETTRGLAATGAVMVPVKSGVSTATLVFGAIAMLSLGALGALLLYRARPPEPAPATTAAASQTAAPPATPTVTATATAAAAPTATASADATAAVSARPRVGPMPKAAPTANATAAPAKRPRDIRSPFD
jgi:serine/threonine-protein kinase